MSVAEEAYDRRTEHGCEATCEGRSPQSDWHLLDAHILDEKDAKEDHHAAGKETEKQGNREDAGEGDEVR